jgi:hypothetical protein
MALHQCEICTNWTLNEDLCDRCEAQREARKRLGRRDTRLSEHRYEIEMGGI